MNRIRVQGCHLLWRSFPTHFFSRVFIRSAVLLPRQCRNTGGLGCSPVARHYWGNHFCFLFLQVLRCFSSLRWLLHSRCHVFNMTGCPIRKSPGQGLFAPNRSLSQLITSFIASESQGIHRLHLTFSLMSYMPTFRHCCLKANILTRALDCLKPRGFSICNRFVSECQRSLLCHSMRSDYAMLIQTNFSTTG